MAQAAWTPQAVGLSYEEIDAAAAAAAAAAASAPAGGNASVGLLHRPAAAFGAAASPVAPGGDGVRRIPSPDPTLGREPASPGSQQQARRPPPPPPPPHRPPSRAAPSLPFPAVGLIEMADMLNPDELIRIDAADTLDELRDDFQPMDMPPSGTPAGPRCSSVMCMCRNTRTRDAEGRVSECLLKGNARGLKNKRCRFGASPKANVLRKANRHNTPTLLRGLGSGGSLTQV